MTREYGNVQSAIWRDREFRLLTAFAQHTYVMLATQPDISSCGVLALTETRWARYASDSSAAAVTAALDSLARHPQRYVVIDEDTGELLVRSFVKHDKGYGNAKRLPAIKAAAGAVESPILRGQINIEMGNLGVDIHLRNSLSPAELDALFRARDTTSGLPEVTVTVTDTVTDTALSSTSTTYSSSSNFSNARELRAVNGGFVSTEAGDE